MLWDGPPLGIREAQWSKVKALQKDLQVQAEARYALMELMDACAPWPNLTQVLHSKGLPKGLPAFHRIESMFALKEMLNEQLLSLCDKGLFHEVGTTGNISKLGSQKKMHLKCLITHMVCYVECGRPLIQTGWRRKARYFSI